MDARRTAAMEAVLDAIERFGPDVSFERIARARPGLGTLVADRPAMVEAVMKWMTQRLTIAVDQRLEGVPQTDAARRLELSVEAFLEWMETHPNTCRFALRHQYRTTVLSDLLRTAACEHALGILRARDPQAAEADLLATAHAMTGAAESVGVWWVRRDFQPARPVVGERLTRQLTALVDAG